jgi:hypothetical protein
MRAESGHEQLTYAVYVALVRAALVVLAKITVHAVGLVLAAPAAVLG